MCKWGNTRLYLFPVNGYTLDYLKPLFCSLTYVCRDKTAEVHSLHQLLWLSWNVKACVLHRPDSIPSSFYPLRLCCLILTGCFLLMEHCSLSESHHTRLFICWLMYCGVVLQMWMQLLGFKKGSVSQTAFSPFLGCVVDTCVPLRVSLFSV